MQTAGWFVYIKRPTSLLLLLLFKLKIVVYINSNEASYSFDFEVKDATKIMRFIHLGKREKQKRKRILPFIRQHSTTAHLLLYWMRHAMHFLCGFVFFNGSRV